MNPERKDGGAAFPQTVAIGPAGDVYSSGDTVEGGMMLRDWFAGQALVGILASLAGKDGVIPNLEKSVAQSAYDNADAMLAERSKP